MASIFTKIVQNEIPAYKLAEDDRFLAFLDVFPLQWGHVLVIPKMEVNYIFGLEDALLGDMMIFAKKVALALEQAVPCKRIGLSVIGLEVPHAHIHLIPINSEKDLEFSAGKKSFSPEEFIALQTEIKKYLS